jgi:hypothetical protein
VLAGTVGMKVGGKKIEVGPGEVVAVAAGVPHRFYNAGDTQARFLCKISPALDFEQLIETMFSLAADGKTSRKGMPNPLRLAVIARHHFDDVGLPVIPHVLQRAALAMGAPSRQGSGLHARVRTCRRGRGSRSVSVPASDAVEFLGRERQARGRTRPQQGWSALLRARVASGAA